MGTNALMYEIDDITLEYFVKRKYTITVFPLISTPGAHLISKF